MSKNKYGGINDMESGWTKVPENKKVYMLWFDMLRRCYDDAQIKRDRGNSYKNCIVCDRWFYLSKFYEDIQKLNGYAALVEMGIPRIHPWGVSNHAIEEDTNARDMKYQN